MQAGSHFWVMPLFWEQSPIGSSLWKKLLNPLLNLKSTVGSYSLQWVFQSLCFKWKVATSLKYLQHNLRVGCRDLPVIVTAVLSRAWANTVKPLGNQGTYQSSPWVLFLLTSSQSEELLFLNYFHRKNCLQSAIKLELLLTMTLILSKL